MGKQVRGFFFYLGVYPSWGYPAVSLKLRDWLIPHNFLPSVPSLLISFSLMSLLTPALERWAPWITEKLGKKPASPHFFSVTLLEITFLPQKQYRPCCADERNTSLHKNEWGNYFLKLLLNVYLPNSVVRHLAPPRQQSGLIWFLLTSFPLSNFNPRAGIGRTFKRHCRKKGWETEFAKWNIVCLWSVWSVNHHVLSKLREGVMRCFDNEAGLGKHFQSGRLPRCSVLASKCDFLWQSLPAFLGP